MRRGKGGILKVRGIFVPFKRKIYSCECSTGCNYYCKLLVRAVSAAVWSLVPFGSEQLLCILRALCAC